MLRDWFWVVFCCLAFLGGWRPALAEVKVLEVRHRPVSEVAAVLEPLLSGEASVSGYQGKLILKASPAELANLEQVVRQLDVPRATLRLSVRQRSGELSTGQREALGGQLQSGPEMSVAVAGRFERTLGSDEQGSDQNLLVLDGEEAFIAVGRDVPFTKEVAVVGGDQFGVAQQTDFRSVSTGFRVRPHLLKDGVQLEVTPHTEILGGNSGQGDLNFKALSTTVVVPLGQWYDLGGHLEHRDEVSRAVLSRQFGNSRTRHQVFIRIDPEP